MNKLFRNSHTKSLHMIIQYDGNNFFKIKDFFGEIDKLSKKNYDTKLIIDLCIDDSCNENMLRIYGPDASKSKHLKLNVKVGDYLVYSLKFNTIVVLHKELVEANFEEITEKEIYEEIGGKPNIREVYLNKYTSGFNRAIQFTGDNVDEIVSFVKSCLNDNTSLIKTSLYPSSTGENNDLELQIENDDHHIIAFKSYLVYEEYFGIKMLAIYSEKEFKSIYIRFDHNEEEQQENHVLTVRSLKNNKIYQAIEFDGENVDEIIEFFKAQCSEYYDNISYTLDDGVLVLKIENNDNTKDFSGIIYIQLFSYIVFMSDSKHFIVYDENRFFELFIIDDIEEEQQENENNIYVDNSVNEVHPPIASTVTNVVNILGTEYKLLREPSSSWKFIEGICGRCDPYLKEITIRIYDVNNMNSEKPPKWFFLHEAEMLHHEIVHAFLIESGLRYNTRSSSNWSENEEMVDWIANQGFKIAKAFEEADEWLKQFFSLKEEE